MFGTFESTVHKIGDCLTSRSYIIRILGTAPLYIPFKLYKVISLHHNIYATLVSSWIWDACGLLNATQCVAGD